MKRIRRIAWFTAAAAAIALIGVSFSSDLLDNAYVSRPRQPVPENGWVAPYVVKGVTVYLTPQETEGIAWLSRSGLGLVLIIVAGGAVGGFGPRPRA